MKHLLIFIMQFALFYRGTCKQYRMSIVSVEDCKDPDLPYASSVPFNYTIQVFNSSRGYALMNASLTVPRDVPGQAIRGSFYFGKETSNGIKWMLKIKDMNCDNVYAKLFIKAFGFPVKGCIIKKGKYTFKDIDIDVVDSAFGAAPIRSYGTFVTRSHLLSKTETLGCWISHVSVAPLKRRSG